MSWFIVGCIHIIRHNAYNNKENITKIALSNRKILSIWHLWSQYWTVPDELLKRPSNWWSFRHKDIGKGNFQYEMNVMILPQWSCLWIYGLRFGSWRFDDIGYFRFCLRQLPIKPFNTWWRSRHDGYMNSTDMKMHASFVVKCLNFEICCRQVSVLFKYAHNAYNRTRRSQ